jgi:hypothetical protein
MCAQESTLNPKRMAANDRHERMIQATKMPPTTHVPQVPNPSSPPGGLLSVPNDITRMHPTMQQSFVHPFMNRQSQVAIGLQNAALGACQPMVHYLPIQMSNPAVPYHLFVSPPNSNATHTYCCRKFADYMHLQMHHKITTGKKKSGRIPHDPKCPQKEWKLM